MADQVMNALRTAAELHGDGAPELASMAGHDGMNLAAAGIPCGMVFVRSRDGVSHSPKEHSSKEDCELGASIMGTAALLLARNLVRAL